MLDAAAYPAIIALAKAIDVPPEWFLAIFTLESGLQSNPHGNNAYAGISQLDVKQLQSKFHVTRDEYTSWAPSKQITDVVTPWYTRAVAAARLGRPPRTIGALYAFNLAPDIVRQKGDAEDVVLYAAPSSGYAGNKALDVNGDGAITIGDLTAFLTTKIQTRQPYIGALALLKTYEGAPVALAAASGAAPYVAAGVVLLGTVAAIYAARMGWLGSPWGSR